MRFFRFYALYRARGYSRSAAIYFAWRNLTHA